MNLDTGDTRLILSVCKANGLLRNQAAYVLATAYHESAHTMKPVRETLASSDAQAISRLENAWKKGQLSWVKTPYWREGFFGRGYVQLTHKTNYEKASKRLGVDFVSSPSLVMKPDYSARILVLGMNEGMFTGKKLSDYITLQRSDFKGARRIVNGTDKASLIAGYAKQYDSMLKAEGYGEATITKKPALPNGKSGGFLATLITAIVNLIAKLFGGRNG